MATPKVTRKKDGTPVYELGGYQMYYAKDGAELQNQDWVLYATYRHVITQLKAIASKFHLQSERNKVGDLLIELDDGIVQPFGECVRFPRDDKYVALGMGSFESDLVQLETAVSYKDKSEERDANLPGRESKERSIKQSLAPNDTSVLDDPKQLSLNNATVAFAHAVKALALYGRGKHSFTRKTFEKEYNLVWGCKTLCPEADCSYTCEDLFFPCPDGLSKNGVIKKGCYFEGLGDPTAEMRKFYPKFIVEMDKPDSVDARKLLWLIMKYKFLNRFEINPEYYTISLQDVAPSLDDYLSEHSFPLTDVVAGINRDYNYDFSVSNGFVNVYYVEKRKDKSYVTGYRIYFLDCNNETEFEEELLALTYKLEFNRLCVRPDFEEEEE